MNTFTISFFGHREIDNHTFIEKELEKIISEILLKEEFVEFLIGRDGEFDQIVSSLIRKCKKKIRDDNCAHILVLPYITAQYKNNAESFSDYYDEIEICEESAKAHFKSAHQIRNRFMLKRSDMVIFYVKRHFGGAYQTMAYAQKEKMTYINLFENEKSEQ